MYASCWFCKEHMRLVNHSKKSDIPCAIRHWDFVLTFRIAIRDFLRYFKYFSFSVLRFIHQRWVLTLVIWDVNSLDGNASKYFFLKCTHSFFSLKVTFYPSSRNENEWMTFCRLFVDCYSCRKGSFQKNDISRNKNPSFSVLIFLEN